MSVIFPKWMNALPTLGALGAVGGAVVVVLGGWYWATPDFFEVGYSPVQPGSGFNHQVHVGKLGMDCRYCHTNVEESPEANIPPVSTCNSCHGENRVSPAISTASDAKVLFIREAYAEDKSIEWRRVHKLPDYVRNFPHDVHVTAGVSCFSCHGQVMAMPQVYQKEGLGMGWCLDCHRHPEKALVPPDKVTDLLWVQGELEARAKGEGTTNTEALRSQLWDSPPQTCGACHQ
ncbi:Molybdopterin oxidoreductase subunit, predicted; chaperone protein HtpG [hydrothermal vent metagenome]|uniref:Molybdopterin oxidoreductase subunit, predicted chaperone protein HtpG n=1 Tax=hydrothermal vent metagenome TaxID=652676 RepID=A0A3B1E042_9ZZZZ